MTQLSDKPLDIFKYVYATCLMLFSVVIVMGLIFSEKTQLSIDAHPAVAFILCWSTLLWLSMIEGGQCSLVGLPPVPREKYEGTHPITHKICAWGHKGDNLDRYLMGRQFLVVFVVFTINISCAPVADASVFGLPDFLTKIFLEGGLAMILFTTQIGQLAAQCSASHMMLDFINNHFMLFTMYACMAVEFSGLVHASYLVQLLVAKLSGQQIESKEEPRTPAMSAFFWLRCLVSLVVLIYAFVITLTALFQAKTTMWDSVPNSVAVIVFIILVSIIGLLEGMQIAFFNVTHKTDEQRAPNFWSKKTCNLLFDKDGHNLPGFMIGRQMCVVSCMFFVARVCTLNVDVGTDENVLGVPDGVQEFFNTGLLAALITTIVGSIVWQLVASAFPVAFLSNPFVYFMLCFCLALEATGICSGAWVLGRITEKIFGWSTDESLVGTPEQRAKEKADKEKADSEEKGQDAGR